MNKLNSISNGLVGLALAFSVWGCGDTVSGENENSSASTLSQAITSSGALLSGVEQSSGALSSTGMSSVSEPTYCEKNPDKCGTLTDERDGQEYRWVTIGTQTWMAENLNYLPENGKAWCPDDTEETCVKFGKLYSFKGATNLDEGLSSDIEYSNVQGACPAGWHVPADAEWATLEQFLGMPESALFGYGGREVGEVGRQLKAQETWTGYFNSEDEYVSGNGTDDYEFGIFGGGYGIQESVYVYAYFWTATIDFAGSAIARTFKNDWLGVGRVGNDNETGFFFVRCVKDN